MAAHEHANPEFKDLDSSGLDLGEDTDLAYRFGEIEETDSGPYLPLSLSFGRPTPEGASRETLHYALFRDHWEDYTEGGSEEDQGVLMAAALKRIEEDVAAFRSGNQQIVNEIIFVEPD